MLLEGIPVLLLSCAGQGQYPGLTSTHPNDFPTYGDQRRNSICCAYEFSKGPQVYGGFSEPPRNTAKIKFAWWLFSIISKISS